MMLKKIKCEGVIVPMITPFLDDGRIDLEASRKIAAHLISNGAVPFIMGTTGESTSIPGAERGPFVKAVQEAASGKAPVYAGIASNCLSESIDMAFEFHELGADYAVANVPGYYPLNPAQIEKYFLTLADAIRMPLLVYNIVSTTHISIPLEVIYRLSEHPNIVGLKDSEQDKHRQLDAIEFCKEKDDFSHLVGWGAICSEAILRGSDGMVPSTGNITPGLYKKLMDAAKAGDIDQAESCQQKANAISAVYQKGRILSESLAALKIMMNEAGLCKPNVLPPLQPLASEEIKKIKSQMKELQLDGHIN